MIQTTNKEKVDFLLCTVEIRRSVAANSNQTRLFSKM